MDNAFSDEEFSPGELAYLQSGGQDSGRLEGELSALMDQAKIGSGPSAGQVADQADQERRDLAAGGPSADQVDQSKTPAAQGSGPSGPSEDQEKKPAHVPLYELQKEREKRQAIESQLAQMQERFSRADERQKMLNQLLGLEPGQQGQGAQKQEELIDPEKDIFGAFKQLQKRYEDLQGRTSQVNDQMRAQSEEARVKQAYASDARTFMQKTSDFPAAYNHLMQVRDQELSALGISDARERMNIMVQEEGNIARQALAGGRSPSEVIYSLAKLRGFAGVPAVPADTGVQAPPAGQVPASNQSDAAKQLEAVQAARAGALSLSAAGSAGSGGLTTQALADMPEDEFEKTFNSLSESQRRKLMGG